MAMQPLVGRREWVAKNVENAYKIDVLGMKKHA